MILIFMVGIPSQLVWQWMPDSWLKLCLAFESKVPWTVLWWIEKSHCLAGDFFLQHHPSLLHMNFYSCCCVSPQETWEENINYSQKYLCKVLVLCDIPIWKLPSRVSLTPVSSSVEHILLGSMKHTFTFQRRWICSMKSQFTASLPVSLKGTFKEPVIIFLWMHSLIMFTFIVLFYYSLKSLCMFTH